MGKRQTVSAARTSGLLFVSAGWALFLALIGTPEAILFTIPIFLLAAPLALGRYVGEDVINAVRGIRRQASSNRPTQSLLPSSSRLVSLVTPRVIPARGPPAVSV